ncbi:hypothetical protein ACFLSA_01315 [Bacteroidota bacterium]
MEKNFRISNNAVLKATGKSWEEWMLFLKRHSAKNLSHKEIVKILKEKAGLKNQWWQQNITSSFEQYIGRRKKGQMQTGFEIGVRKIIAVSIERL